jgi:hypothetical protein
VAAEIFSKKKGWAPMVLRLAEACGKKRRRRNIRRVSVGEGP